MKSYLRAILITFFSALPIIAVAQIRYSLTSTSDFGGGHVRVESFSFMTPSFLTADETFTAAQLEPGCLMGFGDVCGRVDFVINTQAAGWGGPAGRSGFLAWTADLSGTNYYFATADISAFGTHLSDVNNGILTVSTVPEPSSFILFAAGAILLALAKKTFQKESNDI